MENNHVTVLEIDLNAIDFNLSYFKSKLHNTTKVLVVVKAFGYGSNAVEVAKYLAHKVDYFAVAYLIEGIALRNAAIETPIIVLHPQKNNLKKIIKYNLEPNIYSVNLLNSFIKTVKLSGVSNYPIHIKINTGLNRLGFEKTNISKISSLLNKQKDVKVKSIFSHIAASEDLNEQEFTLQQIKAFKSIAASLTNELSYTPFKHMLNTSGIINYANEAQFDMVRLGIGLLGFANDEEETKKLKKCSYFKICYFSNSYN